MLLMLLTSLLGSWPTAAGEALLEAWHTYDLLSMEVEAEPLPRGGGLRVSCALTVRMERPGPLRFLLSAQVSDLTASQDGVPLPATLEGGAFATLARLAGAREADLPALLTLPVGTPLPPEAEIRVLLTYSWKPSGEGFAYAGPRGVQTHLSGFWVPTMADERFDATLHWRSPLPAAALDREEATESGRIFRSSQSVAVLSLVAGEFVEHRRGPWRLLLPPSVEADPEALLTDLAAVTGRLQEWFGAPREESFTLVVEPRLRPAPSYCAGAFVVVQASVLPAVAGRLRWMDLLAHECSHRYWGHGVLTPLVGGGGTFLREGLAQWSGMRVAGALLGVEAETAIERATVRAYLGHVDLRRAAEGHLVANEATLADATYLDDPSVAYLRGMLVHRLVESRVGKEPFRAALRLLAGRESATLEDYALLLQAQADLDYYARTTRLPDFVLDEVEATKGRARARVRCLDPQWPGGALPCLIETEEGRYFVRVALQGGAGELEWRGEGTPRRIEIDPERLLLDPVGSNGRWTG